MHGVDAEHRPIDGGATPHARGKLGEELTRLDLERQGYEVIVERVAIETPKGYFIPDFIVKHQETGQILAVESKFGPGARYTPNQEIGYAHLADDKPVVGVTQQTRAELARAGIVKVDGVMTYRWNTRVVPDADLLAEARANLERAARR
ncbi:hypothetical protein [Blastococcus xanthinilyticus]|uniref:Uncharacterized protein n=1 Tax=Blastococcus xanthinilyticus TaxID=1564164 RepID=A0A5S5CTB6_9ACTN|nr:hypothetical protein [Blastococcus xanthinilyticus]TYP86855.1 hypothetical protein BD833_108140 [Blastococcus xanthinilyticus]